MRCEPANVPDGLLDILGLMPKASLHYMTNRFANCGFREDCELLGEMVRGLGDEAVSRLTRRCKPRRQRKRRK